MISGNTKTLVFVAWVIAVCLAGLALGVTSPANWAVVACIALLPPFVARQFWHAPEKTISESIHEAQQ